MEFKDLTNTKEFQNLHPLKKQIIEELYNSSKNTPMELLLPKVMHTNKELGKRNLGFTKEESQLLIGILKENMSDDERKKVDLIMGFLGR
ncbi:MAG: hypothetical protein Q4D51_12810 [Eubacteriales bacterium]|nr:hypothetical protein [Eubacteriales bacterium]